jgi:hypothetical protein
MWYKNWEENGEKNKPGSCLHVLTACGKKRSKSKKLWEVPEN